MAVLLSYALTNVADVKETLGIASGDTTKDNLIIRKINEATEIIEGYCGRRFKSTTYTDEEYDATGSNYLMLRNYPVITTTSVSIRDTALNENDWTTLTSTEYFVDNNSGAVKAIGRFVGAFNAYKVTYTAGYTSIPADVAEACVKLAGYLIENPTSSTNVKAKAQGPKRIEYFDNQQNSIIEQLGLDEILNRYGGPLVMGV